MQTASQQERHRSRSARLDAGPGEEAASAMRRARELAAAVALDIGHSNSLVHPFTLMRWKSELEEVLALLDGVLAGMHGGE